MLSRPWLVCPRRGQKWTRAKKTPAAR